MSRAEGLGDAFRVTERCGRYPTANTGGELLSPSVGGPTYLKGRRGPKRRTYSDPTGAPWAPRDESRRSKTETPTGREIVVVQQLKRPSRDGDLTHSGSSPAPY